MGAITFLKEKFGKIFNKNKSLPEPHTNSSGLKVEHIDTSNIPTVKPKEQDAFQKVNVNPEEIKKGSLDFAIDQYMNALLYLNENGRGVNSYVALTSLSGLDNSYAGNNFSNQQAFLKNVENGKYNRNAKIYEQPTGAGNTCFYHISTKGFDGNINTRMYLNCKRENVALLADKITSDLGNSGYYLKINADENNHRPRSEQMVFYIDDSEELNRVAQAISRTSQKYPQLFEGSKNMNPFMKSIDGIISYAPEVKDGTYRTLDGGKKDIARSYNTLLGEALDDSLMHAVRDISSKDPKMVEKLNGGYYEQLAPYVVSGVLEDICNSDKKQELINSVKKNLEKAQSQNKYLDIKGIETKDRNKGNSGR